MTSRRRDMHRACRRENGMPRADDDVVSSRVRMTILPDRSESFRLGIPQRDLAECSPLDRDVPSASSRWAAGASGFSSAFLVRRQSRVKRGFRRDGVSGRPDAPERLRPLVHSFEWIRARGSVPSGHSEDAVLRKPAHGGDLSAPLFTFPSRCRSSGGAVSRGCRPENVHRRASKSGPPYRLPLSVPSRERSHRTWRKGQRLGADTQASSTSRRSASSSDQLSPRSQRAMAVATPTTRRHQLVRILSPAGSELWRSDLVPTRLLRASGRAVHDRRRTRQPPASPALRSVEDGAGATGAAAASGTTVTRRRSWRSRGPGRRHVATAPPV